MVPQARRILREYWENLRRVARAGGYCGVVFKSYREVTQGEQLSHTIFNGVMDALVHHWILLVEVGAGGNCGWGREVIHCAVIFYVYYGLVTSAEPVWLQVSFDTLTSV